MKSLAAIFSDASALVKRYAPELGSSTVDALFDASPAPNMLTTAVGCVEAYAILVRRLNGGILDRAGFTSAASALRTEVIEASAFILLPVTDHDFLSCLHLVAKHNLNATDSMLLGLLLKLSRLPGAAPCVLVSSDTRLLRASEFEGLPILNPETATMAEAVAHLRRFS